MTEQTIPGSFHGMSLSQIINRFAIWASVGIFACFCWLFFGFTADDSYIVARYGRNLAEYGLLQFNLGEPINALTSPLHGLIMAGLSILTSDPVSLYKVLAPVFCLLAVLNFIKALPPESQGLGAIVILSSPFVILWSIGGLETPILLGVVALFCSQIIRKGVCASPGLLILAALMFLIRYDSALFTAPAVLAVLWANRSSKVYWVALAVALLLTESWMVYSRMSYGSIFPTSFYLKRGSLSNPYNVYHLIYVANFFALSVGLWVIALILKGKKRQSHHTSLVRYGFYLLIPYFFTMASVHMMFSYRALIPYLPALVVILVSWRSLSRHWSLAVGGLALAINLTLGWTILTTTINPTIAHLWAPEIQDRQEPSTSISFEYARVSIAHYQQFTTILKTQAKALSDHWQSDAEPTLITTAGGVTPWHLPKAHVIEQLVSYRPFCDFSVDGSVGALWRSADYIQLYQDSGGYSYPSMTPDDRAEVEQLHIIQDSYLSFDMNTRTPYSSNPARVVLYYNPKPVPRPAELSQTFLKACRLD